MLPLSYLHNCVRATYHYFFCVYVCLCSEATAKHNKPQEWVETLIPQDFPHINFYRRQAVDAHTRLAAIRPEIAREGQTLTKQLLEQLQSAGGDAAKAGITDPAVVQALALGNKPLVDSQSLSGLRDYERSLLDNTYFGQSRQLFEDFDAEELRRDYLAPKVIDDALNQDLQLRAFKVQFQGEEAQDLGGPYRAIFSEWASELQSEVLPLFIASPNQQIKTERNNDTFILNPSCTRFDLYRRIGKVLGLALRNGITLPFSLPTLFVRPRLSGALYLLAHISAHQLLPVLCDVQWKKLVNLSLQRRDLERIDTVGAKTIANVELFFRSTSALPSTKPPLLSLPSLDLSRDSKMAAANAALSVAAASAAPTELPKNLSDILGHSDTFITRLSDGTIKELVAGGINVKITSDNYEQWIRLALEARLNESNPQMLAVLDGLASVIPLPLFNLYTHTELDWLICGAPDYEVSELRSRCQYKAPVQETDPSTNWLWEVLAEFDRPARAQFLFFVRGARRLGKDDRLHIARLTNSLVPDSNKLLPQASTYVCSKPLCCSTLTPSSAVLCSCIQVLLRAEAAAVHEQRHPSRQALTRDERVRYHGTELERTSRDQTLFIGAVSFCTTPKVIIPLCYVYTKS